MEIIIIKDFDLLSPQWLNIIFDKRNKKYGAYELRNDSSNRHLKAMAVVSVFVIFLMIFLPRFISTRQAHIPVYTTINDDVQVTMINEMEEEPKGDDVVQGEAVKGIDNIAGDLAGLPPPAITELKASTSPNTSAEVSAPEVSSELSLEETARIAKEEEFKARMQGWTNRNLQGDGGTGSGKLGNSETGAEGGKPGHPGGNPFGTKVKGTPGNPLGNGDAIGSLQKPLGTVNCDKQVELLLKVDAQGNVTDITRVDTAISEQECIEAAKRAARKNKFPADASQPVRYARIIYDYSVSRR